MRKTNIEGIKLIKKWESFSPVIYLCSAGVETIGYGETDKKVINEYRWNEWSHKKMTEPEASDLLISSLAKYERAVFNLVNSQVPLSHNEFAALVSFTYNLGRRSLKISTLRKVILREEYSKAPDQFARWVFCKGKRLRGLVNRRNAEIELWGS